MHEPNAPRPNKAADTAAPWIVAATDTAAVVVAATSFPASLVLP
jgi:hypothetical protein